MKTGNGVTNQLEEPTVNLTKALSSIHWLQKAQCYSIPNSAKVIFDKLGDVDLDTDLSGHRAELKDALDMIDRQMNIILQDVVFASCKYRMERKESPEPFTAETALKLAWCILKESIRNAIGEPYKPGMKISKLKIAVREMAPYRTEYAGTVETGTVSGMTRLTGMLDHDGYRHTFFVRFISHPFFQYSHSGNKLPDVETFE